MPKKPFSHLIGFLPPILGIMAMAAISFWYFHLPKVPAGGGRVVEGIIGQPRLLNPLYADQNRIDRELSHLVFRGLIKYNARNQPVGDLAKNWEVKEGGKVYVVALKPNQYWSDGHPVTADDVVFTYQLTQNTAYDGPEKKTFEEVTIDKIDQNHIQFTLKTAFAPFIENLCTGILPAHLWQQIPLDKLKTHPLNLRPVGSGPAKFKAIKFSAKIENWVDWIEFSLPDGYLNSIRFKFYPATSDAITAFKLGEIMSLNLPTYEDFNKLESWPNAIRLIKPTWGRSLVIIFNLRDEKLKDKKVRETLAAGLKLETPGVHSSSPIPQISWAHAQQAKDYQVQKNISLPKKINLKTPYESTYLNTAKTIKNQWKDLGIETVVEPLDQAGIEEIIEKHDFETFLIAQEHGHDPDPYIYWHSSQKESPLMNLSGISHPRIDKALEEGRIKLDLEERKKAYATFQKYFYAEVPAVFLEHLNLYYIASTKIKGLNIRKLWLPQDRFENINEWYLKEKRPLF
ncbi:hypothetical protein B5M47_00940 [candidate division CPR3 bacterium 4484_211]|uniref:Solute-binding protein family 5 domain-containing protein n=1 Tax=candidate division CPR3 bacterium 4484_211 TaxID=1968527 RepID=A0A1W9P0V9_UNCC3|nr:MAG: hypothetical protein B5M47_00940 [candidate division CPR3 bacterium 4484_211]